MAEKKEIKEKGIEAAKASVKDDAEELLAAVSDESAEVSDKSEVSNNSEASSIVSSEAPSSEISSSVSKLDPEYSNLLLVNGENPLPENFDYTGNLSIIEDKYLCGWRNQMNSDAMPYATAMIEAAWADGVELYILSGNRYNSAVCAAQSHIERAIGCLKS